MAVSTLTKADKNFIKRHRLKMSGADIARRIDKKSGVVTHYLKNNGLQVSKELREHFRKQAAIKSQTGKTIVTDEDDQFIIDNYLDIPVKTLGEWLCYSQQAIKGALKRMGLIIPAEIIEERKLMARYQKGMVPVNKGKKMSPETYEKVKRTFFKKGQLSGPMHKKYKVGEIVIWQDHKNRPGSRKYKLIKADNGKLKFYHMHLWEQAYGKVKKGYCLWFKDGDSLNCTLENLECISRAENMRRNTIHRFPQELKEVIYLKNKINKRVYEQQKHRHARA